jgi:hypothetical protein
MLRAFTPTLLGGCPSSFRCRLLVRIRGRKNLDEGGVPHTWSVLPRALVYPALPQFRACSFSARAATWRTSSMGTVTFYGGRTGNAGYFVVDGHPVEYDVGSPPIPQGMPEIFFIGTCNSPNCSTPYTFAVGSLGAISLENGRVSCSARPHRVWKPYCGMNADSLISAVKEKVASSIPERSSK